MSGMPAPATPAECDRLWPAAKAHHLFASAEELRAFRDAGPWRVRVTPRGEAAVLDAWREHLDILAIRALWAAEPNLRAWVSDIASVARTQGFGRLLSPLVPERLAEPYLRAGMSVAERIVALQALAADVATPALPDDVELTLGSAPDLAEVERLDAECFDEFWRYGPVEIATRAASERLVLARDASGELIGYTLATVSGSSATLGRLGVARSARRRGIASALVGDAAAWAVRAGALTIGLCTQEDNAASRALYATCGLVEVEERYVFAICDVRGGQS